MFEEVAKFRAARRLWQALDAALVLSHERIPGCHVYRADDGVHAAWLDVRRQRGGIAARVAMALNPYHHYMLAMEQRMYRDPAFRGKNAGDFDSFVRNVYKVLLTRGMVGTVLYSTDPQTRKLLRGLVDGMSDESDTK